MYLVLYAITISADGDKMFQKHFYFPFWTPLVSMGDFTSLISTHITNDAQTRIKTWCRSARDIPPWQNALRAMITWALEISLSHVVSSKRMLCCCTENTRQNQTRKAGNKTTGVRHWRRGQQTNWTCNGPTHTSTCTYANTRHTTAKLCRKQVFLPPSYIMRIWKPVNRQLIENS
jgi:hypothetical protein